MHFCHKTPLKLCWEIFFLKTYTNKKPTHTKTKKVGKEKHQKERCQQNSGSWKADALVINNFTEMKMLNTCSGKKQIPTTEFQKRLRNWRHLVPLDGRTEEGLKQENWLKIYIRNWFLHPLSLAHTARQKTGEAESEGLWTKGPVTTKGRRAKMKIGGSNKNLPFTHLSPPLFSALAPKTPAAELVLSRQEWRILAEETDQPGIPLSSGAHHLWARAPHAEQVPHS